MGIPDDVVLNGYTLIEQHEVDHEFLINGSPLDAATPVLFALTLAGMLLVAASFFLRGSGRIIAGLLGAILTLTKLWWMPIALAQQFNDSQVFGYTLKYYPPVLAGGLHHCCRHRAGRRRFRVSAPPLARFQHRNRDVHPVRAAELVQDVLDVGLHRGHGDVELPRNLLVIQTLGHQLRHLVLAAA